MRVLVAYSTRHGATRGIAERVGRGLETAGLEVTVVPADKATAVSNYDAYVIGGAAYAWHWMKQSAEFVRANAALLANRPTWLFSSGPIGKDRVDPKGQDVLVSSRPKEFAELEALIKPRQTQVFFGAYDPQAPAVDISEKLMKASMKLMPSMKNALPSGDFREWPVIDEWAKEIAAALHGERTPAFATG